VQRYLFFSINATKVYLSDLILRINGKWIKNISKLFDLQAELVVSMH